ncbi:MAG: hypothetical protein FVQ83_08985 [Chloroflexi bacterium]|nr:hypothetical protein [Chloroflexota bacterium]
MNKSIQIENAPNKIWPIHGWIGLGLVIVFWTLNWSLAGLRTQWGFFPLWLGYCLTVDALVFVRKGSSLLTRSLSKYAGLFLISAPGWWLFEILNLRTQNWIYDGREYFTDFEYFILASISFSTVMPAVFGSAELASTFGWIKHIKKGPRFGSEPMTVSIVFVEGLLMLSMLLVWPRIFFPLMWLSIYFIIEPVNVWLGNTSLVRHTSNGNWRPVFSLWVGGLMCGFFWEMWNFYSYPKWVYQIPLLDFAHVFEMPLLGYGGYIPFAMELFALYHLVNRFTSKESNQNYLQLSSGDG